MNAEAKTRSFKVGLVGAGIQHSSSPSLHMDEAKALGLEYRYELLDLDLLAGGPGELADVLTSAERRGFTGLNITYPCKQAVIPLLHELSSEARELHSVNSVLLRDGKRIGHNTDWWGFAESFRRGLPDVSLSHVVLIGAGGAGAAVGYAALRLGAGSLTIFDTDQSRSHSLAARLAPLFPDRSVAATDDPRASLAGADGLIHATPTGMVKLPGMPVPSECLRRSLWVAEIVYVPLVTELLRTSRSLGCRTLDGSGMAVFQAVMAFELFCGVRPNAARMLARFNSKLPTADA